MSVVAGWRCAACRLRDSLRSGPPAARYRPSITAARAHATSAPSHNAALRRLADRLGLSSEDQTPNRAGRTRDGHRKERDRLGGRSRDPRSQAPLGRGTKRLKLELDLPTMVLADMQRMQSLVNNQGFRIEVGIADEEGVKLFEEFASKLIKTAKLWLRSGEQDSPSYLALRAAYDEGPGNGRDTLRYWLQHYIAQRQIPDSAAVKDAIERLTDLTHPLEWYPMVREMRRDIHLHIGPTNSGKTYHALKRLETAENGVYAGPLRLLAHEVFNRLNSSGRPCDLVTGDVRISAERENPTDQVPMISCTVEMAPLNRAVDVAVIDEIQLMANDVRGAAWTNAVLGMRAKELHLCGEESALPLITSLAASMGDRLHVHRYERLNPLEVMAKSLEGDLGKLRKGDCVVSFSKRAIHMLRAEIERKTNRKVAVIYGTLPPEIRSQQAALFNDPTNDYDFLVASDAIGMGLNLNIQRMIFSDTSKSDGRNVVPLKDAHLKQIAGRAGRFRIAPSQPSQAAPKVLKGPQRPGYVSALANVDLPFLQRGMQATVPSLRHAGIWPPREVIARFASLYPPTTPFSYILHRLVEISRVSSPFTLCNNQDAYRIADIIQQFPNMRVQDRITFTEAPISRKRETMPMVLALAKKVEARQPAPLLELQEFQLELLDRQEDGFDNDYLSSLENLHEGLGIYNWLSYRFETLLVSRPLTTHMLDLVERRIEKVLGELAQDFRNIKAKKKRKKGPAREAARPSTASPSPARQLGNHSSRENMLRPPAEQAVLAAAAA